MRIDSGVAFRVAWRVIPRLPEWLTRWLFTRGADMAWRHNGPGVRQLEKNLARVRPEATAKELRELTREAMRSYARYYAELFMMPALPTDEMDVRVRPHVPEQMRADLEDGSVVMALGHVGNWDLAGAWATRNIAPVLTVVEHLEPERVFRDFVALREAMGVEIIPFEKGGSVFRELVRRATSGTRLVPLLADRDLSASGVEVTLCGQPARLAAGPAALALAIRRPLYFVAIRGDRIEQLHGPRKWGIDLAFIGPVAAPPPGPDAVERYTQAWADLLTAHLTEHPESWHMLQKVFVADLDPSRRRGRATAR
ncbi:MAG: phosphatidylinositol mannoside acyltransferase [Actinomycetales bacterium]|nr:phosphatidylinositol mannoside acyltransferase [Actinomycetales bacterium]